MSHRSLGCLITVLVAMLLPLTSARVAGQGLRWYKMVHSGCPGEPAKFHPCALERAKTFNPPRTADGKPDMQGYWFGGPSNAQDIEEHPASFEVPENPSLIVDPPNGKIPYQAWARAQRDRNPHEYSEPQAQCFLSGVPRQMYVTMGSQILQRPGYFVIAFLFNHAYRVIPTDGRPHIGSSIRLWEADSRGRWEGNTLVIDATNQNSNHWFDAAGNFWSEAAHVIERLTLIDNDTIHYEATIADPKLYTRPWTIVFPIRRNTEKNYEQWEFACHEGEVDSAHLRNLGRKTFGGARPPR